MGAPLFILSFRHRDELSRLAEGAGWQPIAARRADNIEARFIASGAAVAVIDARGALAEGQEAARAVADAVEANAAAMLVLLSRGDAAALDVFHQHGATHFLVSPFTEPQLLHAIQFARRHAERVGGDLRTIRRAGEEAESSSWRWQPGSRTVELSPALARQAGLGEEEGRRISLMDLFRKLDPAGRRAARDAIDRLLATGEATAFAHGESGGGRIAHHLRRSDEGVVGRTEPLPGGGEARDPLTGLRDGRAARAWLAAQLEQANEATPALVAILLSVSRYDAINAAFGRATGDAVLQAAARRIERHVGADGRPKLVARMAGAEFAVLLGAPATLDDGRFLAGQLVEKIGRPFASGDHVITIGSRAGVAAAEAGDDPARLLRRASAALAEAGGDGSPVRVLEEGAESATARGDRLEVDLRRALDRDEIEIRFQPQVSVTSGAIVGVEALARWQHPYYGELDAQTLFGVAEGSDYLPQLSDHVQRKAIAAAAAWPEALGRLRLSVNITAADIVRPGFAAQFLDLVGTAASRRSGSPSRSPRAG
jgi:diguanylate cyclase (GGDEF)-like protein